MTTSTTTTATRLCIAVKPFRDAFALVSPIANPRSPKPILANVLLAVNADGVAELIATDLEVGVRRRVLGVEVDGGMFAGAVAVVLPKERFARILATTRDETLYINIDAEDSNHSLTISGISGKFTLPTEDPDLYPVVPTFDHGAPALSLDPADLRRAIDRTAFATDVESTRYALGGTLWEYEAGDPATLTMVGTDGRRLARQVIAAEAADGLDWPASPVVPVKSLKLIGRALGDVDDVEKAAIAWPPTDGRAASAVMVRAGSATVFARLVEGRFPRYRDVFPSDPTARVDIPAGDLDGALAQAAITTSEESRGVDLAFGPDHGGLLTLSSRAADAGSAEVELRIPWGDQPAVTIAFDPRYVRDMLGVLDPDATVTVELAGEKAAAVMRTGDGYVYVAMPMTRDR